MRRGATCVSDMSHQSATHLICPSACIKLARLLTPRLPLKPRSSRGVSSTSLRLRLPSQAAPPPIQLAFAMSSSGALGGAGTGGPGGSSGRKRGRPFGSKNKVKDLVATPPVSRKRGRSVGSHNKKTLAALAAPAAADSGRSPGFAAAGVIRLQRIHNFWCSILVFTPFA
jgi:hypothetical protein